MAMKKPERPGGKKTGSPGKTHAERTRIAAPKASRPKGGKPAQARTTKGKKGTMKPPAKKTKPKAQKAAGPVKTASAGSERSDDLRRLLIQQREAIVKEAKTEIGKYVKGETRQLVESVLDDGDWSVIDLSEDINLRRLATHREMLLKIDEALRKMRDGTYGVCEECSEEINANRLKVLPFAIYCRDCQEKREEIEKISSEEAV